MSNWRSVEIDRAPLLAMLKNAQQLTAGLDDAQLEKLAAIARPEECGVNCLLTREDERSRDLFIVVNGALSVEMNLTPQDASPISLLKIRDGGVAGELSFLDGARRSASLRAVMPTTVIRFPHDNTEALFGAETGLGLAVMRNLAQLVTHRLRSTNFELRSRLP